VFRRFDNGWYLAKSCYAVVLRDKTLMIFPILSGITVLIFLVTFTDSFWGRELLGIVERVEQGTATTQEKIDAGLVVFAVSFVLFFVVIFFNTALMYCAGRSVEGENTGILDGIGMALRRFPHIIGWTLISIGVGTLLSVVQASLKGLSKNGKVGEIIADKVPHILDTGWRVLTYFVVPVMVFERRNPFSAIGRSKSLIAKTWGEGLGGYFGIGFLSFFLGLPFVMLFVADVFVGKAWVLVVAVIGFLILCILNETAKGVLCAALYQYAAGRTVPPEFEGKLSYFFFRK
jgi:hypothetical protein